MQVIAHPTDFSECSAAAFSHAVGMALTTKSHLYLLHVREPGSSESWTSFPHVRELLARWELMDLRERPSQIEAKLGVGVTKVEIQHEDPASGLFEFMLSHRCSWGQTREDLSTPRLENCASNGSWYPSHTNHRRSVR
jgi:hypothetical protein